MKLRNILGKNNLPDGLKGQGNKNELNEFLSELRKKGQVKPRQICKIKCLSFFVYQS